MTNDKVADTQVNSGSGILVGRDHHGDVYMEQLDETTKKVLTKLSKEAPALGQLLEKALRDGVVSEEAVYAMEAAARSINEDTTNALYHASQSINEDVASSLVHAADTLEKAASKLEEVQFGIERAVDAAPQCHYSAPPASTGLAAHAAQARVPHYEQETFDSEPDLMQKAKTSAIIFAAGFVLGMIFLAWLMSR